jgi:hypothetical protein
MRAAPTAHRKQLLPLKHPCHYGRDVLHPHVESLKTWHSTLCASIDESMARMPPAHMKGVLDFATEARQFPGTAKGYLSNPPKPSVI